MWQLYPRWYGYLVSICFVVFPLVRFPYSTQHTNIGFSSSHLRQHMGLFCAFSFSIQPPYNPETALVIKNRKSCTCVYMRIPMPYFTILFREPEQKVLEDSFDIATMPGRQFLLWEDPLEKRLGLPQHYKKSLDMIWPGQKVPFDNVSSLGTLLSSQDFSQWECSPSKWFNYIGVGGSKKCRKDWGNSDPICKRNLYLISCY